MSDCQPALDKEILFIRGTYPSTDPQLTWDYTQSPPLLSVGGKIAASGSIATSSEVDGSFFAPMALGTGSFNFTPPSGYGGLVYRGGPLFYYWDNVLNHWEPLDFSSHVSNSVSVIAGTGLVGGGPLTGDVTLSVDPNYGFTKLYHNGTLVGNRPIINFQDSVSVSWSMSSDGSISVSAFGTGGGAWVANVNANNFSISNLANINAIPVSSLLTNPFNRNVNGNTFDISGLGNASINNNLTVGGTIYYHGQPLEDVIGSGELWDLNADGSIFRSSNVFIYGSESPLSVSSSSNNNYLYLNSLIWSAFAVKFNNVYSGELGFNASVVELWTKDFLMFRGYNSTGFVYFPGRIGVGVTSPTQQIDIVGSMNATGCYFISGSAFACNDGSGGVNISGGNITATKRVDSPVYYSLGILFAQNSGSGGVNLSNVTNINNVAVNSLKQTPWISNIDGGGFTLTNIGNITSNATVSGGGLSAGSAGINAIGNVNTNGCYYIANTVFACGNGAGGVNLSNIAAINGTPPGTGSGGGVTQGGQVTPPRNLDITYRNTTGKPMFITASIVFNQPGEVIAFADPANPPALAVAKIDTGTAVVGTFTISWWALPNYYYRLARQTGFADGAQYWAEWY